MYTRQNQSSLTAAQKKRFVSALLAVKRKGQYDEFVRMHVAYYVGDGDGGQRVAHMAPTFLPWHRQFLLEFEGALQRVDPGVSVPYWDWTVDRSPTSSLWGEGFLGGNGRRSDRRVMTGPFRLRERALADHGRRDGGRVPDPGLRPPPQSDRAAHEGRTGLGDAGFAVRLRAVELDVIARIPQQGRGLDAGGGERHVP